MAVSSLLVAFLAMQRGQKPCRWSWPTLSCEPHRECKFRWQEFRCVQRTPAAPTKQAASKLQPATPTPKATPAPADAAPAKATAPAAQPGAQGLRHERLHALLQQPVPVQDQQVEHGEGERLPRSRHGVVQVRGVRAALAAVDEVEAEDGQGERQEVHQQQRARD